MCMRMILLISSLTKMGLLLLLMMTMKMMNHMNGHTHPCSWMMLPFGILQDPLTSDNAVKDAYVNDFVKDNAQEDEVTFVTETTASTEVTTTQVNILPQTFQGEVSNSVSLAAPKAAPPGPNRTMTGSLWSETAGGAVANKRPETFCV